MKENKKPLQDRLLLLVIHSLYHVKPTDNLNQTKIDSKELNNEIKQNLNRVLNIDLKDDFFHKTQFVFVELLKKNIIQKKNVKTKNKV